MAGTFTTVVITILVIALLAGGTFFYLYANGKILRTPINEAYKTQIDRLSSTYLKDKELACIDHNGKWLDSETKFGCFDIGEDWESVWCESQEGSIVENICNGINGAKWICDQTSAGCYYPPVLNFSP
jgi:hypothetical protein